VKHHDRERQHDQARRFLILALAACETRDHYGAASLTVAGLGHLGALLGKDRCERLGRQLGDEILRVQRETKTNEAGPEPAEGDPP
jgi:hypothetical protein